MYYASLDMVSSFRLSAGASKLHLAVWNEEVEKVKKLVQKNDVNLVNASDQRGRSPLHLAAAKGNVNLVWPLLSHGASVHARYVRTSRTPYICIYYVQANPPLVVRCEPATIPHPIISSV